MPGSVRPVAPSDRLDWSGMREYWERNHELRARTDLARDPHALGNVCTPEAPEWLNRHYARAQEAVFERLLAFIDVRPGRALDIGCGAARWSERLCMAGWDVTGIDLQQALIEHNRARLPEIAFERVALQDFQPEHRFELICSVTVLGHLPHDEQPRAAERLSMITTPGAHVLLLENLRDQSRHVFANSLAEWTALLEENGFQRIAVVPYDYNPTLRALALVRRVAGTVTRRGRAPVVSADRSIPARTATSNRTLTARAYAVAVALCGKADHRLEPWLTRRAPRLPPPVHAGMLFVRR